MSSDEFFNILDNFFKKLDSAPISTIGVLKSDNHKESYETIFMHSFRKYQAAVYHYNNVRRFLNEHEEFARTNNPLDDGNDGTYAVKLSYSADHYIFELSAFLEALKSSVDFLALGCSYHLPGIQCSSISTLMKLVKDGNNRGPIFDEVRENLDWLDRLRKYRHHFVHCRIISTSCGYERRVIKGVQKTIIYPVIIPDVPPPYIPDTRQRRAMEKSPFSNDSGSFICIKNNDDVEKNIDCTLKYYPPPGYVEIEDFMLQYLISYEKFFTEIICSLSDLDFQRKS